VDAASAETASTASVDSNSGDETESGSGTVALSTAESVAIAMAENSEVDIAVVDVASVSSSAVPILLNGDSIDGADENVTMEGSTATITGAGAYSLSGKLTDGQIIVDTTDEETVALILDGVEINSSTSSAINVINAQNVAIVLADGSVNTLSDGSSYVLAAADENEPNAAVFTKSDLMISGSGSLTAQGNYEDGIVSKDGLVISGGTIQVQAVDDGNGYIYVDANGDGIDVNGGVEMTNGTVVVNGPVENMNGALDYGSGFSVTGGLLVATGSAGMSMAPDPSSSVHLILVNFSAALPAGTLVNIQSSDGENVLTFSPAKTFQSIVVASPDIANGSEYIVSYGGNSIGSAVDGLYEDGSYSGGTDHRYL